MWLISARRRAETLSTLAKITSPLAVLSGLALTLVSIAALPFLGAVIGWQSLKNAADDAWNRLT